MLCCQLLIWYLDTNHNFEYLKSKAWREKGYRLVSVLTIDDKIKTEFLIKILNPKSDLNIESDCLVVMKQLKTCFNLPINNPFDLLMSKTVIFMLVRIWIGHYSDDDTMTLDFESMSIQFSRPHCQILQCTHRSHYLGCACFLSNLVLYIKWRCLNLCLKWFKSMF